MIYIMLGIMIIFFIIMIIVLSKKIKQEKLYKEEYIQKQKQKYDAELATEREAVEQMHQEHQLLEQNYAKEQKKQNEALESRKEMLNAAIAQMEENKKNLERAQSELQEQSKDKLDIVLSNYFQTNLEEYERTLRATQKIIQSDIERETTELYNKCFDELMGLQKDIEEYRAKRAVINEQILKQRAIDEQQDFYRVCLQQNDIDDIRILNSIRANLHKHDGLDKLIYDFYISKPVQEMIKRVLKGESLSGIYKITRLKTGEVYIGKSVDIKSRWQQHAKTVFNCGTIAHSTLHTTMEKDGIENFTFELLEEVPKDKLGEREKYWISFYDTKKYGLNEREG